MKQIRAFLSMAILTVLLALPVALQAQEAGPEGVCYGPSYEAWLAGETAMDPDVWAEDAVQTTVVGDMVTTYNGREEIRAHLEELVADEGFAMEVTVLSVEGNTMTVESKVWDSDTRALGVAPLVATEVCVVEDGKIKTMTWTMSDESLAAMGAALAALPQTGGGPVPGYGSVAALGGLVLIAGLGLGRLRHRKRHLQQ